MADVRLVAASRLGVMSIPSRRTVLALIAAVPLVAGCGSQPLPANDARAMLADLAKVEHGVRAGECQATRPTLRHLDRDVATLPEEVDPEARRTLKGGVDHLARLVTEQCKQKQPEPVVTEPEPVAPPPVESAPDAPPIVTELPPEPESQQREPRDEEATSEKAKDEEPKDEEPKESKETKEPKGDGRDPCPPGSSAVC
jgi:hypothetical protein